MTRLFSKRLYIIFHKTSSYHPQHLMWRYPVPIRPLWLFLLMIAILQTLFSYFPNMLLIPILAFPFSKYYSHLCLCRWGKTYKLLLGSYSSATNIKWYKQYLYLSTKSCRTIWSIRLLSHLSTLLTPCPALSILGSMIAFQSPTKTICFRSSRNSANCRKKKPSPQRYLGYKPRPPRTRNF